jgi:mRNA interferase MazF
MVKKPYVPSRGDMVWVNLNPTRGHEQANIRPALVLSPLNYNKKTGLCVVCPVTSQIKAYPFEVVIEGKKVQGAILSDHVRSLDWRQRDLRFIEKVPSRTLEEVTEKLSVLIAG